MAYKKSDLELQALEAITSKKLVFIDEVVSYLPCSSSTFYLHELEKSEALKAALNKNKVDLKGGLRKKWYDSDSATSQIALYKLLGTEEEAHRLNGSISKVEIASKDGLPLFAPTITVIAGPQIAKSEDSIDESILP